MSHVFSSIPPLFQVDDLLCEDVDEDSEFAAHRKKHEKLKPEVPNNYLAEVKFLKSSPPEPVPVKEGA